MNDDPFGKVRPPLIVNMEEGPPYEAVDLPLRRDIFGWIYARPEMTFHIPNARGEVELFARRSPTEPLAVGLGQENGQLLFHIYLADGEILDFSFQLNQEQDLSEAISLTEQLEIPLYFITDSSGSSHAGAPAEWQVSHCFILGLPEKVKKKLSHIVKHLVLDQKAHPAEEEMLKAGGMKILRYRWHTASTFDCSWLMPEGLALTIDLGALEERLGLEAHAHIYSRVEEALIHVQNHRIKKVREATFTLWSVRRRLTDPQIPSGLVETIYFNPVPEGYYTGASCYLDPFFQLLRKIPEFVRLEGAYPILEGAIPRFTYQGGQLQRWRFEKEFCVLLSNYFTIKNEGLKGMKREQNPYNVYLDNWFERTIPVSAAKRQGI